MTNDTPDDRLFGEDAPLRIADQGYFFVGGEYAESADGSHMSGQLFVLLTHSQSGPFGWIGIRGNGHMMMLEKNNLEIAAYFRRWLDEKVS